MPAQDKKRRACKAAKAKFRLGDASGDGRLDLQELSALLRRGDPTLKDSEVRRLFREIDANADGRIDFSEFCDYVFDQADAAAQPVPRDVKEAFYHFNGVNEKMSSSEFYKFCKEACLHNDSFRQSDAAIVFSKVKPKSQREIGIKQFGQALRLIADKRGCDVEEVHQALAIFADHEDFETPAWSREMNSYASAQRAQRHAEEIHVGVEGRRTGKLLDVFLSRSLDETKGNISGRIMMGIIEDAGLVGFRGFNARAAEALVDWALERSCERSGALTFDHFSEVLFQISQKMGCDFSVVEEKVAELA